MTDKQKASESGSSPVDSKQGFSDEEKEAMRERAREIKSEQKKGRRAKTGNGEEDVLLKISKMPEPDRSMAQRIHAIVKATAPELAPKTWYGMPAYARDGKVVCFFQNAQKFKTRYSTFGFNDNAQLDEGDMWPTAFALVKLTPDIESRIASLVRKAAG
jgi:uncharacterized protein YdhG (YjbR/CyaY superfamily)